MKELNGFEALCSEVGTEFLVKYECGTERKVIVYKDNEGTFLRYTDINNEFKVSVMDFHKDIVTAKFIPIQKPVSFMEAVESGKKISCDVEDLLINDPTTEFLKGYHYLIDILAKLPTSRVTNIGIKNIILNGKWYVED